MNFSIQITEIYRSIQGESTFAGLPCTFIRLTGCDLRCHYCDSAYAFTGGNRMCGEDILEKVKALECELVEITGGEPLLQKGVHPLMTRLCDSGRTVLIETSGAHDISGIDSRVHRIVDLKCPSSGECGRNLFSNLQHLRPSDEVKFVIGSREDFEWACSQVGQHGLVNRVGSVLFSPAFTTAPAAGQTAGHAGLEPRILVEWILQSRVPVRFQLQMHKYVWEPTRKGV